jgi:competence protein ComEA
MRLGVGAAVVLLIAAAVVAVLVAAMAQRGNSEPIAATSSLRSALPSPAGSGAPDGGLLVHVTGAVHSAGLVSLGAGSRVVDAIAAAGGLTDDADPAAVNLARPVADGEQLVVPRVGEGPLAVGGAGAPAGAGGGSGPGGGSGVVNLNTATQAELETLPRIGPALAQRILDWRTANGRFAQPTDLLKVTGIGQKLFDGLKDQVVI